MYIKSLLIDATPTDIQMQLAEKIRNLRLKKNISQELLSQKAGLSYASYRKFEATGEISLKSFIKLAITLNLVEELKNLFSDENFESMDELLASKKNKTRKRARNNGK